MRRLIPLLLAMSMPAGLAAASDMNVAIDQTSMFSLDRPAKTLVVGNPSIADVSTQDGKIVFLMGRSFGTTNFIALDAEGKEIVNAKVTVSGAPGRVVTLQRGAARTTLSCADRCEPTAMPGDGADSFSAAAQQIQQKAGLGTPSGQ